MSVDISKLENVKYRGSNFTARCPACAETGTDKKGNHLSVDEKGRFTCIIYPQGHGKDHRKHIYALVGIHESSNKYHCHPIEVKEVNREKMGITIKKDILGHLGHLKATPYKSETDILGGLGHLGRLNQTPYEYTDDFQDSEKDAPASLKSIDEPLSIKKFCKCGHVATVYEFGKTETGKRDWMFWCSTCNPYMSYCSECDNPAVPYIDKFGRPIEDKCNVHGKKVKLTHTEILEGLRELSLIKKMLYSLERTAL